MSERIGPMAPKLVCTGCKFHKVRRYQVQGDSGHDLYCAHPTVERKPGEETLYGKYIADSDPTAPDWCPVLPAASPRVEPAPRPEQGPLTYDELDAIIAADGRGWLETDGVIAIFLALRERGLSCGDHPEMPDLYKEPSR